MYPDNFKNEPSKKTPWVILEPGRIFIMGRSIPENPGEFYRLILDWISVYSASYTGKTKIELGFEYVNTSSTKWIYNILKELSVIKELARNVKFNWYYERGDEDMFELGQMLKTLVDCPFDIIEVTEMSRMQYDRILAGNLK